MTRQRYLCALIGSLIGPLAASGQVSATSSAPAARPKGPRVVKLALRPAAARTRR